MRWLASLPLSAVAWFAAGWALIVLALPRLTFVAFALWCRARVRLNGDPSVPAFGSAYWVSWRGAAAVALTPPLALAALCWGARLALPAP
jgi:hypothetical protein